MFELSGGGIPDLRVQARFEGTSTQREENPEMMAASWCPRREPPSEGLLLGHVW